jgi:predicted DNA-binding transcriptional regulator AlpA
MAHPEPALPIRVHQGDQAPSVEQATHRLADRPDAGPKPLLVKRRQAAKLCGVSLATWDRLDAAKKTPAAVRLGQAKLYSVAELIDWINHGCPDRKTWQAMQARTRDRA